MKFRYHRNPSVYLSETREYIEDLQRITLLRDKCQDSKEKESYTNLINVMQEVLIFMNTIAKKDKPK